MNLPPDRVVYALTHTAELPKGSLADWELLVRQARQANLLGRIGEQLTALGLMEQVPLAPRQHIVAMMRLAQAQREEVQREFEYLLRALSPIGVHVVLLKGAAYLAGGLVAAMGRVFSDTDILVPHDRLAEVESKLMVHGWMGAQSSAYEQRYYREWMHELPPLEHMRRGTALDVHHTILPRTARLKPDAAKLLAAARPVAGLDGFSVLAPVDMVLHSMTHLFHNDDLSHGLRDLSDLDLLLRQFGQLPNFWVELVDRATEMDLARPLHYGLRSTHRLLGTPVPAAATARAASAAPMRPLSLLMDGLWRRALQSQHPTAAPAFTPAALFLLYLRAHWLRMPPLLLIRHLSIKAWQRARPEPTKPSATPV